MCYSKEVQLSTGLILSVLSLYYYWCYKIKFQALNKKWLIPFLNQIIIAFLLIGGHQIFEFLSLETGNQIVYKTGLMLSISSMYFFLKSLEIILNRNLKSKIALWVIGAVAVHAFLVPMTFAETKFHLQHQSAFIWASAWMFLFIYFHICAIRGRQLLTDDQSKKSVIFYLLATLDISFLLSVIYVLWGYSRFSLNVCTDSPSVWCTFFVVQALALPAFLSALPKILERPSKKTSQSFKQTLCYVLIALIILSALIALLPFFSCLSLKFVFP